MQLFDSLFRTLPVADLFSDRARVQGMLDFEAALARAEAKCGIIPAPAAETIAAHCVAEKISFAELRDAAALSGNLAIPLVKQLIAQVHAHNPEAARFVHWGATSQDAIDTGLALQLRDLAPLMRHDLAQLTEALGRLADLHRRTPVVGRTWLQQAIPTSLGFQFAGWLDALNHHRRFLLDSLREVNVLQFGGAVGTLAALDGKGLQVARTLAELLRLDLPAISWHTHRGRLARLASAMGLLTGTLGKCARDLSLMMQTEIAEASEPVVSGRGGSSTMPHKHNPVACAAVLAAAIRVPPLVSAMLSSMVQEHERGLGSWQAEWEVLPELVALSAGALQHFAQTVSGLRLDVARMRANLEATHGLIFAEAVAMILAPSIGRSPAHQLLEAAARKSASEGKHLQEVLAADPSVTAHIPLAKLKELFDPSRYLGNAGEFIDRVLEAHRALAKLDFNAAEASR